MHVAGASLLGNASCNLLKHELTQTSQLQWQCIAAPDFESQICMALTSHTHHGKRIANLLQILCRSQVPGIVGNPHSALRQGLHQLLCLTGVYGGLDEWVHHFTNLKNTSVLGFEPDSKDMGDRKSEAALQKC